jgi:DNA-binding XRE family transcriptional regulator
MKAMSKQQLAEAAGVSTKTLMSWCEPFMKELETMGMQPNMKVLPPCIVRFIAEKFCIDIV